MKPLSLLVLLIPAPLAVPAAGPQDDSFAAAGNEGLPISARADKTANGIRRVRFLMKPPSSSLLCLALALTASPLHAGREEFATPRHGANLGVWRITRDSAIRDWANYHNTQCWSPDGRYLCHTHWAPDLGRYGDHSIEVHVYDVHRDESRRVERGFNPRWARHRNWLFFVRILPRDQSRPEPAVEVRRLDLDSGELSTIAGGAIETLGETTHDDRWLLGARRFRGRTPEFVTVRIGLGPKSEVEEMPQVVGSQLLPNPRTPVFFTRQDHKREAFGATRWFYDLDGGNQRLAVPTLQQCHMSWLGNGEYLLLGNGLVRGRKWDQPFPSNVEILAGIAVGDISPCGRSGRYVCGDRNVADLRSGGGWHWIEPLSMISYPAAAGDQSGNYDADPKGSPDGTKIAFVTNYDLKDGPLAFIANGQGARDGTLRVDSTEGFPASGRLTVSSEVIAYERKTPMSFEGITREVYETRRASWKDGAPVTSFDVRLMTDDQWGRIPGAPSAMRKTIPEGSPLLRQRQTDIHVALVRKPDRPQLRLVGAGVELIPGEEHFETMGYHLWRDGCRLAGEPLRPGATFALDDPGEYRAAAVEWSGLESEPGLPLKVDRPATLTVLAETPADFSWTGERWLSGGADIPAERAKAAPEAIREIVHRHDGVIRREWHRDGVITEAHDLDAEGRATRRLRFGGGRLCEREYRDVNGARLSLEIFDGEGFIVESARFRPDGTEQERWWFERGMPVRQRTRGEEFFKEGGQWISKKTGKPWTLE